MMKAALFDKHGDPQVLTYTDAPMPQPSAGEVRLRVRACGINALDISVRANDFHRLDLPHILGSDVSGEVDALGKDVSGWKTGDEVMVCPVVACDDCPSCRAGKPGYCTNTNLVGYANPGGYAQFLTVPAEALLPKPASLSHVQAASLPLAGLTAHHMIVFRGKLQPGEKALVFGASGGVGTQALQICRALGAWTSAVTRDEGKRGQLMELGADAVFLSQPESWANDARETAPEGFDLVVDSLAGTYLEDAITLLKPGGRIVMIHSSATPERGMDSFNPLFRKQIAVIGSRTGAKADLEGFMDLVTAGKVAPVVDRVFPLSEAAAAHAFFQRRQHVGKVVLSVG